MDDRRSHDDGGRPETPREGGDGGRIEGWRGGGYGGPIPVRSRKKVSDIAGKAPGGAAPAGNAARGGKG